ncbi:unnamed protein product [Eruca vesicaria subsp. sativa]|uniref:Bifunctional inhibitor/plant lipid transfer protein/seed storage helical domain-containing protein n=1 Tax=Eruca vesicaria subsp. sativa TaxID=29727 RepID=A0ABC8J820_ERUVS|nr:unnamed protein product [Eruca vesicaria subsp. sativa]
MKHGMCLLLLLVSLALMSTVSVAVISTSCTDVLISMAPCLGYITGNSSSPSQQCCGRLAHVVRFSAECLCELLKGGQPHLGVNFNQTQALALPKACNVQTPPISRCNEHGNVSKTVPGHGSSSSHGSSIKFSFPLMAIFSVAYYITIYSKTDF